jgi:hypothetical protein
MLELAKIATVNWSSYIVERDQPEMQNKRWGMYRVKENKITVVPQGIELRTSSDPRATLVANFH